MEQIRRMINFCFSALRLSLARVMRIEREVLDNIEDSLTRPLQTMIGVTNIDLMVFVSVLALCMLVPLTKLGYIEKESKLVLAMILIHFVNLSHVRGMMKKSVEDLDYQARLFDPESKALFVMRLFIVYLTLKSLATREWVDFGQYAAIYIVHLLGECTPLENHTSNIRFWFNNLRNTEDYYS